MHISNLTSQPEPKGVSKVSHKIHLPQTPHSGHDMLLSYTYVHGSALVSNGSLIECEPQFTFIQTAILRLSRYAVQYDIAKLNQHDLNIHTA